MMEKSYDLGHSSFFVEIVNHKMSNFDSETISN